MDKIDSFLDKIYQNRAVYLRYFAVIIVGSLLRLLLGFLLNVIGFAEGSDSMVAWFLWALAIYAPLKLWVFKSHCGDIYRLLTQMMIYALCMFGLWTVRSIVISLLYVITSSTPLAMALGGVICELLCLALMINVVFRKKKS